MTARMDRNRPAISPKLPEAPTINTIFNRAKLDLYRKMVGDADAAKILEAKLGRVVATTLLGKIGTNRFLAAEGCIGNFNEDPLWLEKLVTEQSEKLQERGLSEPEVEKAKQDAVTAILQIPDGAWNLEAVGRELSASFNLGILENWRASYGGLVGTVLFERMRTHGSEQALCESCKKFLAERPKDMEEVIDNALGSIGDLGLGLSGEQMVHLGEVMAHAIFDIQEENWGETALKEVGALVAEEALKLRFGHSVGTALYSKVARGEITDIAAYTAPWNDDPTALQRLIDQEAKRAVGKGQVSDEKLRNTKSRMATAVLQNGGDETFTGGRLREILRDVARSAFKGKNVSFNDMTTIHYDFNDPEAMRRSRLNPAVLLEDQLIKLHQEGEPTQEFLDSLTDKSTMSELVSLWDRQNDLTGEKFVGQIKQIWARTGNPSADDVIRHMQAARKAGGRAKD